MLLAMTMGKDTLQRREDVRFTIGCALRNDKFIVTKRESCATKVLDKYSIC